MTAVFILATSDTHKRKDLILWSDKNKLQWKDFKKNGGIESRSAGTCYTIKLEDKITINGKIIVKICAYFIKSESWKKKSTVGEYLLKHEQGHFDIAEIYARKIRKKLLSETNFQEVKVAEVKIRSSQLGLFRESSSYQDIYDKETDHSKNVEAQERWNKKIEEELVSLEAYSNPEITLNIESEKKY